MEKIVTLITLIPDDYHGAPMIRSFCPPGNFSIPTEQEVFDAWSDAGYNAFQWDPDNVNGDASEEEIFKEYGDSPIFYAGYMIIHPDLGKDQIELIISESFNDLAYYQGNFIINSITPEDLCKKCLSDSRIETMIPLGSQN